MDEITILTGNAKDLIRGIPDGSVDLIFTDPPYAKDYLHLYAWLAEVSVRVLKPDGFLLVYCGGYSKAAVMELLNAHLEFFWDYIEIHSRESTMIQARRTLAKYKSILAYRRRGSKALPVTSVLGAFEVLTGYNGKQYHLWGQDESTARYLIDCFSCPGDLVLDPFVGGGTTPYVCSLLARRCIGFEIDPNAADIARARIAGWKPLPVQLSLWEER